MKKKARARHETVNRRIKQFNILSNRYRSDLGMHGVVFTAICVITQIAIQTDSPLFQVDYFDNYDIL